jgi:hypothetical protein
MRGVGVDDEYVAGTTTCQVRGGAEVVLVVVDAEGPGRDHVRDPTVYATDSLERPRPREFLDLAVTVRRVHLRRLVMVQVCDVRTAVHDFPPAVTVVEMTADPPLDVGWANLTLML